MTENKDRNADSSETKAETAPLANSTGTSTESGDGKSNSGSGKGDTGKAEKRGKKAEKQSPPLLQDSVSAKTVKEKKPGRAVAWLALLLALAGAGGAGYTYWMMEQYQLADKMAVQSTENRLLANAQQQADVISADLRAYQQRMAEQEKAIEEMIMRVANTRRQIGEITHVSRRSWMLAEAEYLLRLANQRLVLEQESSSVYALLKATDDILVKVDDIHLHEVRRQIAREMAALKALGTLDIQGTFLTLSALAEQLSDLPLLSPRQEQTETTVDERDYSVDSVLEKLSDLVVIRQRNQPVAPLLPPEQHYYVQQNLRLMLEQAQLALLQRKQLLFRQSLENAERWIKDYFQLNNATTAMLESIADLKVITIAPELPDISRSLTLLKAYLTNPENPLPGNANSSEPMTASGMEGIE